MSAKYLYLSIAAFTSTINNLHQVLESTHQKIIYRSTSNNIYISTTYYYFLNDPQFWQYVRASTTHKIRQLHTSSPAIDTDGVLWYIDQSLDRNRTDPKCTPSD